MRAKKSQAITCMHQEHLTFNHEDHTEIGECSICHQVRKYFHEQERDGHWPKTKVLKLGRINGLIVIPDNRLDLSSLEAKEKKELDKLKSQGYELLPANPAPVSNKKAPESAPEVESAVLVYEAGGKHRKVKRKGLYKWKWKCAECVHSYKHGDAILCDTPKCPQRCPSKLRPPFRLKSLDESILIEKVELEEPEKIPQLEDWEFGYLLALLDSRPSNTRASKNISKKISELIKK